MNNPGVLRLFFDYVDPASYLLDRRLRLLEKSGGFKLALAAFEISPPPGPLLNPEEGAWAQHWNSFEEAGRELEIELKRPWIVPWSRKAHELAFHARKEGCFPEIHETLFRAYLLEGLDIGRVDVLVDLGRKHGLDPTETKTVLDIDLHRASVLEARDEALKAGATQPPTLVFDGRRMDGYPDDDTLGTFLDLR